MFTTENITFVLEIIGTVAFALSGAVVGLNKKMDLLGIIILGLSPAIGGGIIRDLVLGVHPPKTFQNPVYACIAIAAILVFCLPVVQNFFAKRKHLYDQLMLWTDAIGLGIFTAVGVAGAYHLSADYSLFLYIFTGAVTGVGGGVLRDTMASVPPYIFVKHFYGTASIIGAAVCALIWETLGETMSVTLCTVLVIVLRILAAKYRWSLPKPGAKDFVE